MGIERPGQPPFSQSTTAATHPESSGDEASHRGRMVERLCAGSDDSEPCNRTLVERSASNAADATLQRDVVVVDTTRVALTPANADEAFLADLKKRFAASGEEGISAQNDHPLHYAATHGLIQSVQFLLSAGNKQHLFALRDREQNNLVHLAAKRGHTRLLHWLIGQYGSMALKAKGHDGLRALHYAAREGHLECVQLLLTVHQGGVLDEDDRGSNPVHWAAEAGKLAVLRCMVEQYGASVLLTPGDDGLNPLQFAIRKEHMDCVSYILETCLGSIKSKNKFGQNAIHEAAKTGNTEIFNYLITRADTEDIHARDENNGNTALHLAAAWGRAEVVEILLNASDRILATKNNDPSTAAHLAAVSGHLPILKQIARRKINTIIEPGNGGWTPLHFVLRNGHIECAEWLLANATIRKNLTRIDLYSSLTCPDAQCRSLLAKARKDLAEPRRSQALHHLGRINPVGVAREWPLKRPKKSNLLSREWPALCAQHRQWSSGFVDLAKAVLTGFDGIGIYLVNSVYPCETRDKFLTSGDLNAGVQMAKILGDMGLESLEVILSPPDDSSRQRRMAFTDDRKELYASWQEVARYKLAQLCPGIDPEKPFPQTLKLDNCLVTFRDCDDLVPLPQVMFSFVTAGDQLSNTGKLPEIGITLKPYRFASLFQQIIADIHDGRGNVLPLNLPPNSVISEVHRSQPDGGLSALSSDTSLLGGVVNHLVRQSRAAKIDVSVVYGLHHGNICDPEYILTRWINNLWDLGRAAPVKKPTIIAVASNILLEHPLQALAKRMGLPVIDLVALTRADALGQKRIARAGQELIVSLLPGEPAICILPNLPKNQFDELVLSCRLPVLVEGANLTSFLLEHGRPHLSLLPTGQTPVAQDMGDPLEAIKAEAFSSKLSMDEQSLRFLLSLKSLLEREGAKVYQEALQRIDVMDKKEALAFLWRDRRKDTFLGLKLLSIRTLLERGSIKGTLGEAGRKALMSALDPSLQGFMQYIREAMDEASPTATHFKLQQMHLEGASVHSINSALIQLGRYKGWIQ